MCEERDALYRLSETHLVGEDSVDSLVVEIGQPVHPLQLVCFECPPEHGRLRHLPLAVQDRSGQTELLVNCTEGGGERERETEREREGERGREQGCE